MNDKLVQAGFDGGQGGGGGSTWSTVLKVTGIGCAVILLVGGVLAGLGVFKAATCCSQFADLAEVSQDARDLGYEFGQALHQGDYEAAYGYLDEGVRETTSQQDFVSEMEGFADQLAASEPFPVLIEMDENIDMKSVGESSRWRLKTRFVGPRSEQSLELLMDAEYRVNAEDQEIRDRGITSWELSPRSRILEDDESARAAQRVYNQIRQERFSEAATMVSVFGPMREDGQEDLEQALRAIFEKTGGERATIASVYPHDQEMIGVQLVVRQVDGSAQVVDFLITATNNQVFEIAPVRDATPGQLPAPEVEIEESEESSENEADEEMDEGEDSPNGEEDEDNGEVEESQMESGLNE